MHTPHDRQTGVAAMTHYPLSSNTHVMAARIGGQELRRSAARDSDGDRHYDVWGLLMCGVRRQSWIPMRSARRGAC
jgi:hypothetical protein